MAAIARNIVASAAVIWLVALSMPVSAHLGTGGPVARTVGLTITQVRTTTDKDDGIDDNTEIYIEATVTHATHGSLLSQEIEVTDDYNWDNGPGAFQAVNVPIWSHVECEPSEPLTLQLHAYEDDATGDEDLGLSGLEVFRDMEASTGNHFTRTFTTAAGSGGAVELTVDAHALTAPTADQQCEDEKTVPMTGRAALLAVTIMFVLIGRRRIVKIR